MFVVLQVTTSRKGARVMQTSVADRKKSAKGTASNQETTKPDSKIGEGTQKPNKSRCSEIAESGIRTGADFALLMSSLMSDIIEGAITPQESNAIVNAGGKLLKITELQLKYGKTGENAVGRSLKLVG